MHGMEQERFLKGTMDAEQAKRDLHGRSKPHNYRVLVLKQTINSLLIFQESRAQVKNFPNQGFFSKYYLFIACILKSCQSVVHRPAAHGHHWDLVRNAKSQTYCQTQLIRICIVTRSLLLCVHTEMREALSKRPAWRQTETLKYTMGKDPLGVTGLREDW